MTDMTNEERTALIELADGAAELSTEMTRALARRGLATYTHGPNGQISFITPTGRKIASTLAPLKEEAGQ